MKDAPTAAVNVTESKELQMANDRRDDDEQIEPSTEAEQVRDDADASPAERKDPDKAKEEERMDDRFQATDN
jgi:hypothetical protein